jgi:hypothetical protein
VSFESLWPHLSALHSNAQPASAVEWKVLYASRPRPLLVPAGSQMQACAAIDFFVGHPLLRWWGYLMLLLDRWLPSSRLLPLARSERFPIDNLFGAKARSETHFAIHCGSPGPLRKLTIFCPPHEGEENGEISKVATQASADQSVTREAYWLRTLSEFPAIARFLPRLLRDGTLPCGRRFVTMSVLPFGVLSSRFREPHFRFLEMLATRECGVRRWSETEAYNRLCNRVQGLGEMLEPGYRGLFTDICAEIDQVIGPLEIPVCLVHGDFAPWNMRVAGKELLVFDWEYAEAGGSPLHDFLHFHLVTRATRQSVIGSRYMRQLLVRAEDHASRVFGPGAFGPAAVGALTLHYLLDTVAFYSEASRFLDIDHPVVRAYLEVLEQRRRWLPQSPAEHEYPSEHFERV